MVTGYVHMNVKKARRIIEDIKKDRLQRLKLHFYQPIIPFVKQILGDPVHLIPEMVQNADDVKALVVEIDINKERIIFHNNGDEFRENHIDAICDVLKSTKKSLQDIGNFGFGFKSVFAVSQKPEIYSGHYSFSFDDKTMIVPDWIPPKPEFSEWKTSTRLPFKDEQAVNATFKSISKLEDENAKFLLFLKNVEEVHIKKGNTENIYKKEVRTYPGLEKLGQNFKIIEINKNGKKGELFCVYTLKKDIPPDLLEHLIANRRLLDKSIDKNKKYETTVNISFKLDSNCHIVDEKYGLLHAFLPTKVKTYLPFDINADFLLNPNREELNRPDDKYNCWLFDLVVICIKNIIEEYKQNVSREFWKDIYNIIPREEKREEWIEDKICESIIEFVKEGKFFITDIDKKNWVSRTEVVDAHPEIRKLFPLFSEISFVNKKSEKFYLSRKINKKVRDFLTQKFKLKNIDQNYLFDALSEADILKNKTDEWFLDFFYYLANEYDKINSNESTDFLNKVKKCYLIPCSENKIVKLSDNKVYRTTKELPIFISDKLLELRPNFYEKLVENIKYKNDEEKKKLTKNFVYMLIKEATANNIYDDLIRHEFYKVGNEEVEEERCKLLDKYILYIKDNIKDLKTKEMKIKLRQKDRRIYRDSDDLYLANDYLKDKTGNPSYDIEKLVGECENTYFVASEYLNLSGQEKTNDIEGWKSFLVLICVKICPNIDSKNVFKAVDRDDFIKNYNEKIGPLSFDFEGGGTYTGNDYYSMKEYAYILSDFNFEDSFVLILNKKLKEKDSDFFVEFLKMINFNWDEIECYVKYKYRYFSGVVDGKQNTDVEKTSDNSSLGKWLTEEEWMPTKNKNGEIKFQKSQQVYVFLSETANIEDAYYVEADMVATKVRPFLMLKTRIESPLQPFPPTEDVDNLLENYKIWQEKKTILDKEIQKQLGKLYKQVSKKLEEEKGTDVTWKKFENVVLMVYNSLGKWTKLNNIHYYLSDKNISKNLKNEIMSEVLLIPDNIKYSDITPLLMKLDIRDLLSEANRDLLDKVNPVVVEEENYFVVLANSIISFFEEDDQDKNRENCEKISNIKSYRVDRLAHVLKIGEKIVSEQIKTDGFLDDDNIFWHTGDISYLVGDVSKEICRKFNFHDEKIKDFIEKVFACNEKRIENILKNHERGYKVLFKKIEEEKYSEYKGEKNKEMREQGEEKSEKGIQEKENVEDDDFKEQENLISLIKPTQSRPEIIKELKVVTPQTPELVEFRGEKYKRDNKIIAQLKILRDFKCQICGASIQKRDNTFYIEAAHITEKEHKGSETPDNILILCPNHHKEFDLGKKNILEKTTEKIVFELNGKRYELNLELK
jgi:predicted restriction endonuclease